MKNIKTIKISARLETAQTFCKTCSANIKKELIKIEGVNNVQMFPLSSIIAFTFKRANDLSEALNMLTEMGYPEKVTHDRFQKQQMALC